MGWDSIFDIFRGGKSSSNRKAITSDNITKKDEINGSIKSDKDNATDEVPNDNIKSILKNVPKIPDINKISEKSISNDDKPKVPAPFTVTDKLPTPPPIEVPKTPEFLKKSIDIPKVPEIIPKLPELSKPVINDAKINIPKEPSVVPEQTPTTLPSAEPPKQTSPIIDISTKPKIIDNLPKTPVLPSPTAPPSQQFNGSGNGNIVSDSGINNTNRTNDFIENQKSNLPKAFENGNTTATTETVFDNKKSGDIKDATNAFLSEESSTMPRMKPAVPPKRYKPPQNLPQ